jgi:DNA polymerase elongation subunit (family B)
MHEVLVTDIETVKDETIDAGLLAELNEAAMGKRGADAEKIAAGLALSPMTGKICCVGWRHGDYAAGATKIEWRGGASTLVSKDEKTVLTKIADLFEATSQLTTFVTFNGKPFDMPFIKVRCAIQGIPLQYKIRDSKYDLGSHFDIRSALTNFDQYGKGTLPQWAARFGIEVKYPDLDGSMTQRFYDLDELPQIALHCESDILITSQLFERTFRYF